MPKLGPLYIKYIAISFALLWAMLIILASWFYRDDFFQTIYDPRKPFQTYTPPPAPDYTTEQAWLARPAADIDPISISGGDVFVVVPSIYLGGKHWVAPTENSKVKANLQRVILPNYVWPYQSAGRVFAPSYRQAALYSFLTSRDDARFAQKFAYSDVKRAFGVFLKHNPPERPIILIGHGQGGLHVQRLLNEYFNGSRKQKIAAAYIIDHPLPLDRFDAEFPSLHPCENEEDINCVISFNAVRPQEKVRKRLFTDRALVWNRGRLEAVKKRPLLCTNPLLWTRSTDHAPAKLHLGGAAAEGLEIDTLPAPSPMQTGAQCKDGLLYIDKPKQKSLQRPSRFGGKFRTLASNLFYEDLRVDAARRAKNLIDQNILPRRSPLLKLQAIEVDKRPITKPLKRMKKKK